MFQGSFKDVLREFLGCFTEVSSVFQQSVNNVSRVSSVFQESFKDDSRKFQGCLTKVSRVFQGSVKGVSRIIQGCFKKV